MWQTAGMTRIISLVFVCVKERKKARHRAGDGDFSIQKVVQV